MKHFCYYRISKDPTSNQRSGLVKFVLPWWRVAVMIEAQTIASLPCLVLG